MNTICQQHIRLVVLMVTLCMILPSAHSQNYLSSTGLPTFTTALPVKNGVINVANGNLHIEIPVRGFPQRGGRTLQEKFVYNSRIWYIDSSGPSKIWRASTDGWRFSNGYADVSVNNSVTFVPCGASGYYILSNYTWIDENGTTHTFAAQIVEDGNPPSGCTLPPSTPTAYANDSSGFMISVGPTSSTVYYPDGTQFTPPDPISGFSITGDANGNFISFDPNDGTTYVIDTLYRQPVHPAVCLSGVCTYSLSNSQNTTNDYSEPFTSVVITTNFGQSGVTEGSSTVAQTQSIALPDGTSYQFHYDSYGELTSMVLPTGGTVTFSYTNFQDAKGNINRWATGYIAAGGTWSYTPAVITTCAPGTENCKQKVTVTKPSGDATVYTFTLNSYGAWNTHTVEYSGPPTGTVLRDTTLNYDMSQPSFIRLTSSVVMLPTPAGNVNTRKTYSYDSAQFGNITSVLEWKYYIGTQPPNPDRKYFWSFVSGSGYTNYTQYVAKNILNKVAVFTVQDGASTQLAQTRNTYDSTALTSKTGIVQHDDTNYGTGNTIRGNVTLVQRWLTGSTFLSTTNFYDTTGQLVQTVDPRNNPATTFSFVDRFYNDNGSNPPSSIGSNPSNAYLTQMTRPLSGATTYGYYFGTGKQAMAKDQNLADSYSHFMDSMERPTHTYLPLTNGNRGWTLLTYPASSETQVDTYTGITSTTASSSCTSCRHDQQLLDTWGRASRTTLLSDPDGATNSDTSYDTTGRLQVTTNPYRSTSDPTYGSDTTTYDGIDHVASLQHTDGNVAHTYYGTAVSSNGGASSQLCSTATYGIGYPVLAVDEAGKKRQKWLNDHDKLIEVDEADSSNNLTVATCYGYDGLDDLINVVQGSETRSYTYDALSRMTSETNPESGVTNYYYTTSAGALCSGDPSLLCRKTDSRGVTITFTYDAENRITGKTYSDTTPAVSYFYDQTSYNGLTITNGKGRRTGMSDGSGQTAWSYDTCGRILSERRTVAGITKTISYSYNLDGSLASETYPSGRIVTYAYSNAARLISATDTANAINYSATAIYAPQGALASLIYGKVNGGFAGITLTYGYNNRLQLSATKAMSSNGTVLDLSYNYDLGGGSNNGNVASITNNRNAGRTQLFTYDYMNRVATAKTQATSGTDCWGQSFGYDRYANLLNANVTQCSAPSLSLSVNTSNRITNTGFSYDAAGNMTADGTGTSYAFDAEGKQKSAAGVNYTYDGLGWRVQKSNGELDWFNGGHSLLFESDLSGNVTKEYIWFGSLRVARRDSNGSVYYYFADALGSGRVMTNATGVTQQESDYYPFGGERVITNTVANDLKFTGKKRDTETGLDYSLARMSNSALGRWTSPDPAGLGAVDLQNPQTWNRYAYVRNNSVNAVDPLGMLDCIVATLGGGPCDGGGAGAASQGGDRVFSEFYGSNSFDQSDRGGASLSACGVDPFCRQNGGIGPFGSPVANGKSWNDSTYATGGNYITKTPTPELTLNCVGQRIDMGCSWDPFSLSWVVNGDQSHRINGMYPGLAPGDQPIGSIGQGVLPEVYRRAAPITKPAFWAAWTAMAAAPTAVPGLNTLGVSAWRAVYSYAESYGIPATAMTLNFVRNWQYLRNAQKGIEWGIKRLTE